MFVLGFRLANIVNILYITPYYYYFGCHIGGKKQSVVLAKGYLYAQLHPSISLFHFVISFHLFVSFRVIIFVEHTEPNIWTVVAFPAQFLP